VTCPYCRLPVDPEDDDVDCCPMGPVVHLACLPVVYLPSALYVFHLTEPPLFAAMQAAA
jgi:hypothetical protein